MTRKAFIFGFALVTVLIAVALIRFTERVPDAPAGATSPGTLSSSSAPFQSGREAAAPPPEGPIRGSAHKTPQSQLPGGSVRNYLPGLLRSASGPPPSGEAAFAAFQALNACRLRQTHPPSHGEVAHDESRPSLQECDGITEKDWADAPRLLKLAADLGSERAQIAYARKEPLDGKRLEDFVQHPEELVAFKNNANRYLIAASEAGNVDAMWFLSESLRTGDLFQRDLVAAYAYKLALSRTGVYPAQYVGADLAALGAHLTPEQVRIAGESADKFLARCCKGTSVHK